MSPAAQSLLDRLDETRQRWWLFSMLCNVMLAIGVSVGLLALFIFLDVLLKLPQLWLVVLFVLWLAATLAVIVRTFVFVIRRQHELPATARQAELSYPELGSDLINVLQLSASDNGVPEDFREAAINEAANRAGKVPFQRAAEKLSRFWRWRLWMQTPRDLIEFAGALVLLFVLCFVLTVAFPTWSSAMDRLFSPWQFVPQQGEVEILEVVPGDTALLAGSRLEITARIANPNQEQHVATLFCTKGDGREEAETAMFPNEIHDTFTFSFPAVFDPMTYRLEIGDSQTQLYAVELQQMPTVQGVEVTYEYPAYLQRPKEVVQQKHADLQAPQFTVARLKLQCSSELSEGHAIVEGEKIGGGVKGRTLRLDLPMTKQTSYTIHLVSMDGLINADPRINMFRVVTDAPPTVQLAKPARESTAAVGDEVPIVARANDDNGLGAVRIETKPAESDTDDAESELHVLKQWELSGVTAMTLTHPLTIDAANFKPGDTILVRAVAVDQRRYRGGGLRLEPQETASGWHRIRLIDPAVASQEELERIETINAKLWSILQRQIRARVVATIVQKEADFTRVMNKVQDVRQSQIEIQTASAALAKSIDSADSDPDRQIKQSVAKLAHGEMLLAVQQADSAAKMSGLDEVPDSLPPLVETQDRIIEVLRRLLQQSRQAISEKLSEMEDRPGGDLPEDVAEKLRELKDKMQEFLDQQKRVIEATENLAKKPVDDFTEEDERLLQELAAVEDDWARFMEETHSDFSKLPEQDFSNPSMLEEFVEIQTEIKMAKDALTKKTADIAVPLEQLGAEMAEQLVTNIEKWLPDTPDRERWSQEEYADDELKEAPMAELPGELEDLVGELMEEEEDLFDEMEDISSSAADSLDAGAGWDAADGPISNMSAKGVTGNRLPNSSEIGGRSGEGRQGKSSGEFVGDTAVGKGGRKTPSRLNPDPFVKGEVNDQSKDPVGGATGGGKESGVGGEGLEGPLPNRIQEDLHRLAQKQANLRNRAEAVDLKFDIMNYHHTDLKKLIDVMAAVEKDLRSGRYQSALRRREVLLDGLGNIKTYLEGEFEIRRDMTTNLPDDIQKELLGSMQDDSPEGWEELNRKYFERLATEEQVEELDTEQ